MCYYTIYLALSLLHCFFLVFRCYDSILSRADDIEPILKLFNGNLIPKLIKDVRNVDLELQTRQAYNAICPNPFANLEPGCGDVLSSAISATYLKCGDISTFKAQFLSKFDPADIGNSTLSITPMENQFFAEMCGNPDCFKSFYKNRDSIIAKV